jgi:hypothetical protein
MPRSPTFPADTRLPVPATPSPLEHQAWSSVTMRPPDPRRRRASSISARYRSRYVSGATRREGLSSASSATTGVATAAVTRMNGVDRLLGCHHPPRDSTCRRPQRDQQSIREPREPAAPEPSARPHQPVGAANLLRTLDRESRLEDVPLVERLPSCRDHGRHRWPLPRRTVEGRPDGLRRRLLVPPAPAHWVRRYLVHLPAALDGARSPAGGLDHRDGVRGVPPPLRVLQPAGRP